MSRRSQSSSPPSQLELEHRRMRDEIDNLKQEVEDLRALYTDVSSDVLKIIGDQAKQNRNPYHTPPPYRTAQHTQTPQAYEPPPRPRRPPHYHQRTVLGTPPPIERVEGSHESSSGSETQERRRRVVDGERRRRVVDDDRGVKVDLPEFNGSSDPNVFIDWLHEIERVFEFKGYDDVKRCKVAILKFKSYASLWWENTRSKRERDGKAKIQSWDKLKRCLKKKVLAREPQARPLFKIA